MKIYTRTGDTGETALFGGGRVPKDHPRVAACGTVDELNAVLGRAIRMLTARDFAERLPRVQHDLFAIGAHLAAPRRAGGEAHARLPALPLERPDEMEDWIDQAESELEPLKEFILPGGSPGAAELHVCRTVCRRAERAVVHFARASESEGSGVAGEGYSEDAPPGDGDPPPAAFAVRYLNRLSDLLFVQARLENRRAGLADVTWRRTAP